MGWKCTAENRRQLLAGTEWNSTGIVSGSKRTKTQTLPKRGHVAVDANAILRSKVFDKQSPLDVAKMLAGMAVSSSPARIEVFFDADDKAMYPPQRAAVHQERYPASAMPAGDVILKSIAVFGASTVSELAGINVDCLPMLTSRQIDWNICFKVPMIKAFLWRLFVAAVRHAFLERVALGTMVDCTVHIHAPDGTVLIIGNGAPFDPPVRFYGEADLQTFDSARTHNLRKEPVVMYSIDTDFLLMTLATVSFVPVAPFIVHLKSGITDGARLIEKYGKGDVETRLNVTFWFMAQGCDYADSLTRQGYFTKDIINLGLRPLQFVQARGVNAITFDGKNATLSNKRASQLLDEGRRRKTKERTVRAPIVDTFGTIMFCLQYYGLMFPRAGAPFPPEIQTHYKEASDTYVIPVV